MSASLKSTLITMTLTHWGLQQTILLTYMSSVEVINGSYRAALNSFVFSGQKLVCVCVCVCECLCVYVCALYEFRTIW